jgi:Ca2+-binding EF-hand superfamily protein
MPTELQTKKLTHRFSLLDTDGDGVISQSDYEAIATRLATRYGAQKGSPQYEMLMAIHVSLWTELRQLADANGDGQVSSSEYVNAYAILLARSDAYDRLVAKPARGIIAMADQDGDGRLSQREYADGMSGYNLPESLASQSFRQLDRDGDGYITLDEMLKNVEEFYMSSDPAARGNWLFGPV